MKQLIFASRFILNINYHQCPLIVSLIPFMSISKEKINVPELMTINVHKNKQRSCNINSSLRVYLNINYHQCPLIVPLIHSFISKEKN